jgi:hypothetical protein
MDKNMTGEAHGTRWEKFQRIITIASVIFGMVTPIAIFYVGYVITNEDQRRQEQNRKFDILIRVGPFLLEDEPRKILFALRMIDDAGLDKGLVGPVLVIAKDVFRRPEVANEARDLLSKWVPPEQLLEIASSNPDPTLRAVASQVVAQNSQPERVQQIAAQTASPAVQKAARSVLDTHWVVWIASTSNENDANRIAKVANDTFLSRRIGLTAEVSSPDDNGSGFWAVTVGKQIDMKDAQTRLLKARSAGYSDAFVAPFRSS